jgi:hypothetical protein
MSRTIWRCALGAGISLTLLGIGGSFAAATTPEPDGGIRLTPTQGVEGGSDSTSYRRGGQGWYESGQNAGDTLNCLNGTPEPLGRAYVGWYGNPGTDPKVGDFYYVKTGWGVTGSPCTGGAYVHTEIFLPPYTQLAITAQTPVQCWHKSPGPNQPLVRLRQQDCPQAPQQGSQGGLAFDPPPSTGEAAWPTATGALDEIWIPVRSTRPLNGTDGNPCQTCIQAATWMIDGIDSPWVYPKKPVLVVGSQTSFPPSITYPAPSTTDVRYDAALNKAFATTNGYLFTQGTVGETWFEIGETNSYGVEGPHYTTPNAGDFIVTEDWQMDPGKTYHFRLCYQPSGGNEICGADQVFQAPPDTSIGAVEVKRRNVKVTFASPTPDLAFECSLDRGSWETCASPASFRRLAFGNHTIAVRAKDDASNVDATPARQRFRIVRPQ